MRYLVLVIVQVVLFSSLAHGTPTVFLIDGTKEMGSSIWTEDNKIYLSNSNEIHEFNSDEIKLDQTLKYNKIGSYQVTPEEGKTVSVTAVKKQRRERKSSLVKADMRQEKQVAPPAAATPATTPPASPVPAATAPAAPAAKAPAAAAPVPKPAEPPPPVSAAAATTAKAPEPQKTMPPLPTAAAQNIGGFSLLTLLIIVLAISLVVIAASWVIFEKAGHAGWKSLIPIYNMYILMQIAGKPGWWVFLLFIPLVSVVILLLAMLSLAKRFGRSELFGVGIFLLPMIFLPLMAFNNPQYEG